MPSSEHVQRLPRRCGGRRPLAAGIDRGYDALPGNASPIASLTQAIVFAVNMPPQEPAPGQATCSSSCSSASVMLPGAVRAHAFEDVLHGDVVALIRAGHDRPAVEEHAGQVDPRQRHHHARAGVLSQPPMATRPS